MECVGKMLCGLYSMPKVEYIHVVTADKPLSHCCFADPEKPKDKVPSIRVVQSPSPDGLLPHTSARLASARPLDPNHAPRRASGLYTGVHRPESAV